jgi:hypothetical protein
LFWLSKIPHVFESPKEEKAVAKVVSPQGTANILKVHPDEE